MIKKVKEESQAVRVEESYPVGGEIEALVGALDAVISNLLSLRIHKAGGGQDVTHSTRPPREVVSFRVAGYLLSACPGEDVTTAAVDEDEARDARHPVLT